MQIKDIEIIGRFTKLTDAQIYSILENEARGLVDAIRASISNAVRVKSSRLSDSIRYERIGKTEIRIFGDDTIAPYLKYIENGTPAHDIRAKDGGSLRFLDVGNKYGQNNKDNYAYFKKVRHPGTKKYAPFEKAVEANRVSIIQRVQALADLTLEQEETE